MKGVLHDVAVRTNKVILSVSECSVRATLTPPRVLNIDHPWAIGMKKNGFLPDMMCEIKNEGKSGSGMAGILVLMFMIYLVNEGEDREMMACICVIDMWLEKFWNERVLPSLTASWAVLGHLLSVDPILPLVLHLLYRFRPPVVLVLRKSIASRPCCSGSRHLSHFCGCDW